MCSYSDPHLLDTHNMAQTAAHTRAPGHQAGMAHQPAPTLVYQPAFFVALGPALGSGEGVGRAAPAEPAPQSHRWAVILAFTVFLPSDSVTLVL